MVLGVLGVLGVLRVLGNLCGVSAVLGVLGVLLYNLLKCLKSLGDWKLFSGGSAVFGRLGSLGSFKVLGDPWALKVLGAFGLGLGSWVPWGRHSHWELLRPFGKPPQGGCHIQSFPFEKFSGCLWEFSGNLG